MTLPALPRLADPPRTVREIVAMLEAKLAAAGFDADRDPLRDALVQIAARYAARVARCIDAAPDAHLDAFADMIGGQARPAAAAHAVLSFNAAPGPAPAVVVPMHTRVAAAGTDPPVVFETLADLTLVRAEAVRALLVDAGHRRVADLGALLTPSGRAGDPFAAAVPVEQALHIAQRAVLGAAGLRRVTVQVDVAKATPSMPALLWSVRTPGGDVPLAVESDSTAGLAQSGEVRLVPPATWPAASVDGIESCWLTLRPASASATSPRLSRIAVGSSAAVAPQPPAAVAGDGVPLDASLDFYPFGERPRFGSVFQVQSPMFGVPGARIEVRIVLANPYGATAAPIPPVNREGRPVVVWELSTAGGFRPIAAGDGTRALTEDGTLAFTVPDDVAPAAVAGVRGPWLRARLASGHYGSATAAATPFAPQPAPAIHALAVQSTLERGPLAPEHLVAQGALTTRWIDSQPAAPFDAFPLPDVDGPALYVAVAAAPGALGAGTILDWLVRPAQPAPPLEIGDVPVAPPAPRWQARSTDGWRDLAVRDATTGIVRVAFPDSVSSWTGSLVDPAAQWRWLRLVWPAGTTAADAVPRGLAINAVAARHSQRLRDEVVGSGDGRPGQVARALRTPIVGEASLQVREGREPDGGWTTWREVDDLAASGPASRDFALDRSTGEVRFGDGRHGRIPPPGIGNLRLHDYATGGGRRGNVASGTLTQLQSAVPAVEAVVDVDPAAGGLDAETPTDVRRRASAWLRHRDRAVAADDYADLARDATPEVARAYCVAGPEPGLRVIVIPRGGASEPQPDAALLAAVKAHLDARRPPFGRLVVAGPRYARVAVTLRVAARPEASPHEVAAAVARRVARFLHPLAGGDDGRGWRPGERPHRSDIQGLADRVDGVDGVRSLALTVDPDSGPGDIVAAGAIDVAAAE